MMRCLHVLWSLYLNIISLDSRATVHAAPTTSSPEPQQSASLCVVGELSSQTWIQQDLDTFLANVSAHYREYDWDNVQALATFLGAPNFFCGPNLWCNAGQPCDMASLKAWYVLMGIQGWNTYVNNLDTALGYVAAIFSLHLPKMVNDLWHKPSIGLLTVKRALGVLNGMIDAFPIAYTAGEGIGMLSSAVLGINLVLANNIFPPSADVQFLHWVNLADELATIIDQYKVSVNAYAAKVIDAPINDTKWGINSQLKGGRFLYRQRNFTQEDVENWMYRSFEVNMLGLILQSQNFYIIRTFNVTKDLCVKPKWEHETDGELCVEQPNGRYTRYRLQKKGEAGGISGLENNGDQGNGRNNPEPEWWIIHKLVATYKLTKEYIFLGPTTCYDNNDYEQLTDPWEMRENHGFIIDPMLSCNFNLLVCDMDYAEDQFYGKTEWRSGGVNWDEICESQGLEWV